MLYKVSPGGASMWPPEGKFRILFSRTRENAFLDTFSKTFVFLPQMLFSSAEKWQGHGPTGPLVAWALGSRFNSLQSSVS